MNDEIRENFRVDEITIGHGGDRSVGLPSEYSTISLSEEMAEILQDNGTTEQFKNELFELFKKYNDEVQECTDDLDIISDGMYECLSDISEDEKAERIKQLENERRNIYPFSKMHQIELFLLKSENE